MLANELKIGHFFTIKEILTQDAETATRFYRLGLYPENSIKLVRKAPIFGDPLLFNVNGSQIALTKAESKFILCYQKDAENNSTETKEK